MGERRGAIDMRDTWDISSPWSNILQQRQLGMISGVYGHRQGEEEMGREGPACAKG